MPIQNIMTCSEFHLDSEYDYVIKQLVMYSQTIDPYESYDKYVWSEPVRMPQREYHNDKDIFRLVRAERALRSKPKGKK